MDCTAANLELLAHEREDLTVDEAIRLRAHLAGCQACRRELRDHRQLRVLLDRAGIEPRAGFVAQVMSAVREGGSAAGIQTGVSLAAHELQDALDAQVRSVRRAVLAIRQRAWTLSVSVAAHAAVLLVFATVLASRGDPGTAHSLQSRIIVHTEIPRELPYDVDQGSFGSEPRRMDELGVRGTAVELDWEDEDVAYQPDPDPEAPGRQPRRRFPDPPPVPAGEGDKWALLPGAIEEEARTPERIGQTQDLLALRAEATPGRRSTLSQYASLRSVSSAIDQSLAWLASEQDDDGSWSPVTAAPDGFDRQELGEPTLRVAVTALAVLPFLAEGIHSESPAPYGEQVVRRAIAYLEARQDLSTGGIGHTEGGRSMFNHALASAALGENLALIAQASARGELGEDSAPSSPGSAYRQRARVVQRALAFLRRTQIRPAARSGGQADVAGGWGYAPDSRVTDTNVSAWGVQALLAYEAAARVLGRRGGLKLEQAYAGASDWLRAYTDPLTGQVGYNGFRQYGRYGPQTLTAVGLLTELVTGAAVDQHLADAQERMLLAQPPSFSLDGDGPDFCRGYFSALALYLKDAKSAAFRKWYRTAVDDLVALQVHGDDAGQDETLVGSWPLVCRWSQYGGRVYNTSMATLVLQMPYRYAAD